MTIIPDSYLSQCDQMVPESSFNVVSQQTNGLEVIQGQLSQQQSPHHQKSLPDFDTLLKDLSETTGYSEYPSTFVAYPSVDSSPLSSLDSCYNSGTDTSSLESSQSSDTAYWDLSMYDDTPELLKPVKVEQIKVEAPDYPVLALPDETIFADNMFDEVKKKIQFACSYLDIPENPYYWTEDQVQQWVMWILNQYSLPYCGHFQMDGTTLCMLSKDDFQVRSPQVGQYIFTELDVWKNAYDLFVVPSTVQPCQVVEEEPVQYLDLDAISQVSCTTTLTSMSGNNICTGGGIPTSVITSAMRPAPMVSRSMLPDTATLTQTANLPLSISPAPSLESLASSGSSSWASSSTLISSSQELDDSQQSSYSMSSLSSANEEPAPPRPSHGKHTIHLWQFLKDLLNQPQKYQRYIRWLDESRGIFKIEESAKVAKLWGQRKNRPAMNYDKLSRSIRQYYKKQIIKKTSNSKRLVYQFCPQYL